jgi:signal transduction histidine kinase
MKANQKKIETKLNVDEKLNVLANSVSTSDLLVILLDNAIKFSDEGTEVWVSARRNGRYVEISVADKGPGIKPADIPHIFERFYRADPSRSKNQTEGYGLGLPLAKKIAEANHASLSVKSKVGEGTTFCIRLISKS